MRPNLGADAKARLAKRAKRAKFWKENKNKIIVLFLLVVVAPGVFLFSSAGPNTLYRDPIKELMKNAPAGTLPAEVVEKQNDMAVLYSWTLRYPQAVKEWDKIAEWYFGFSLLEWANNPARSEEIRARAENRRNNIERGKGKPEDRVPPPYIPFPAEAIPLVERAIIEVAESLLHTQPAKRTQRNRILEEIYMKDFIETRKNPFDPERKAWVEEQIKVFKIG